MSLERLENIGDLIAAHDGLNTLYTWALKHKITVSVEASDVVSSVNAAKSLLIEAPERKPIRIHIFDEYDDARSDNPLLCLILLEVERDEIVQAGGIAYWAKTNCLEATEPSVIRAHGDNLAARSTFLAAFGPIPDAGCNFDLEMNMGAGRALRGLSYVIGTD